MSNLKTFLIPMFWNVNYYKREKIINKKIMKYCEIYFTFFSGNDNLYKYCKMVIMTHIHIFFAYCSTEFKGISNYAVKIHHVP